MIKVYDDKKGKHQSFEADVIQQHGDFAMPSGYGATEQEAVEDLKQKMARHIAHLQHSLEYLQNIDYSQVTRRT